jgi:hypothetical protein
MAEQEHKFLLSAAQAAHWMDLLHRHLGAARDGHNRTIYLDTEDLAFFRARGGQRQRVRIREYAADETGRHMQRNCYLELKASSGVSRRKARLALPCVAARALLRGEAIAPWWQSIEHSPDLAPLLPLLARGDLRPRVCTWYRRSAFEHDRLRVTLDADLSFCRPALPGRLHRPSSVFCELPVRVLEIKSQGDVPAWLQCAMATNTSASGFSKFEAAMAAVIEYDREMAIRPSRPTAVTGGGLSRAPGASQPCS